MPKSPKKTKSEKVGTVELRAADLYSILKALHFALKTPPDNETRDRMRSAALKIKRLLDMLGTGEHLN